MKHAVEIIIFAREHRTKKKGKKPLNETLKVSFLLIIRSTNTTAAWMTTGVTGLMRDERENIGDQRQ